MAERWAIIYGSSADSPSHFCIIFNKVISLESHTTCLSVGLPAPKAWHDGSNHGTLSSKRAEEWHKGKWTEIFLQCEGSVCDPYRKPLNTLYCQSCTERTDKAMSWSERARKAPVQGGTNKNRLAGWREITALKELEGKQTAGLCKEVWNWGQKASGQIPAKQKRGWSAAEAIMQNALWVQKQQQKTKLRSKETNSY